MKLDIKDIEKFCRVLDLAAYNIYDKDLDGVKEMEAEIQNLYQQINSDKSQELIDYDPDEEKYFANSQIETANNEIVTQESEESFWDTLISKLVERDIADEIEAEVIDEEDQKVQLIKHDQFTKEYTNAFYNNGIDNLYLVDFEGDESAEDDNEDEGAVKE